MCNSATANRAGRGLNTVRSMCESLQCGKKQNYPKTDPGDNDPLCGVLSRLPRDNDPLCGVLSRLPGDNDPLCGVLSPLFPWTHFCHFFDTARPVCPPSSSPPSPSSPHCLPLPLLCPRPPRPARIPPHALSSAPSPTSALMSSPLTDTPSLASLPAVLPRPPSPPPARIPSTTVSHIGVLSYIPPRSRPPVTPLNTESHTLAPSHCATPNPKKIEHPRSFGMFIMFERNWDEQHVYTVNI